MVFTFIVQSLRRSHGPIFRDVYIHSSIYAQVSWTFILRCLRSLFNLCSGLMDLYSEVFTFILQSMLRSHGPIF